MEEINNRSSRLKSSVELFLDNDPAGDEKTVAAKELIKMASDNRGLYRDFQDLNDFLVSTQARKLGR